MSETRRAFVVCLSNDGYAASLEVRKLYEVIPDADAGDHGLIRVIDESGESYLYPRSCFADLELPSDVARALSTG